MIFNPNKCKENIIEEIVKCDVYNRAWVSEESIFFYGPSSFSKRTYYDSFIEIQRRL